MNGENAPSAWSPRVNPYVIALSVMLATFMEVLDTSVANVSLPHIAGSLSSSTDEATWVLTSYLVANAVVLPMTGWLSARFGRKRFLMFCIMSFTAASALCGAAGSLGLLILSRIIQGAAGGALQPVSQAIILETFPAEKRGQGMSIFAMGVVVAPIIGPTLGGWITDNYSWRWIFYINIPIGIAAVWLISMFVEDPPYLQKRQTGRLDILGFSFLTFWLATLQFVLDRGQELDWLGSSVITWSLAISMVSFIAFVIRELTTSEPLVNLRILLNRNFAVGTGLVFLLGALLYGTTAALPLFMQNLLGYTATNAGLALSPRGAGAFFAAIVAGRLMGIVKPRPLILAGFVAMMISCYLLGQINLQIGMPQIVLPIVIAGLSITLVFVPLSVVTMGGLPAEQTGAATGLYNLMRNLGGSFGISLLQTFVTRESQKTQDVLSAHTTMLNPTFQHQLAAAQQVLAPHVGGPNAMHQAYQVVYDLLQQQAASLAYVDAFQLLTVICLASLPFVFLLRNVEPKGPAAAAH
jgi:MFS transporter, DHA2 family, multidrug resistance protein